MAIQVEFEGYVNEVKEYGWGNVYDVSHRQVIKNASGDWETSGYDYFNVAVGKDDVLFANASQFYKNGRVLVKGTLKTKRYEKKDGSGTAVSLQVRATDIQPITTDGKVQPGAKQQEPVVNTTLADNAPF